MLKHRGRFELTGGFDAPLLVDTADIALDAIDDTLIADDAIGSEHIQAGAVLGANIPESAIGSIEQTAVALDHAATSPFELLAADASNDRLCWVRAVATEAAAGTPDIDVGSETTDPNAIVDDYGSGVWAIGDRFEGLCRLPAGEALDATIVTAGTAGAFNCYITAVTLVAATANIGDDAVTSAKMTLTVPVTVGLSATLANRGGAAADGVLVGTLTASAVDYAYADDGGAFTDETAEANSAGANDMTLMPANEATSDAYYLGQDSIFSGIKLTVGTAGVVAGTALSSITWEYGRAADWATLETSQFVDDSISFTAGTSTYFTTFTPPTDWAAKVVNAQSAFWIRARCVVADFTTTPVGTQVWILESDVGSGIYMPIAGTISAVQAHATTNSATNADSIFVLINITQGTVDTFTWTGGDVMERDTSVSLAVAAGDEVAIQMVQEDGTTEFAGASLILEVTL